MVYSGPKDITVDSGNPSVGIDFDGGGAEFNIRLQSWQTTHTTQWSATRYYPQTTGYQTTQWIPYTSHRGRWCSTPASTAS